MCRLATTRPVGPLGHRAPAGANPYHFQGHKGQACIRRTVAQDRDYYDTAHLLQQEHARLWLILWAPVSRAYFALYHGDSVVKPLAAPTANALRRATRETE